MVKITQNNPFPTQDVVPAAVVDPVVLGNIQQLIQKAVQFQAAKEHDGKISVKAVGSKNASGTFKVSVDKKGQATCKLNDTAKAVIQAEMSKGAVETESMKVLVNELFKACLKQIDAFKKAHPGKVNKKVSKKDKDKHAHKHSHKHDHKHDKHKSHKK